MRLGDPALPWRGLFVWPANWFMAHLTAVNDASMLNPIGVRGVIFLRYLTAIGNVTYQSMREYFSPRFQN